MCNVNKNNSMNRKDNPAGRLLLILQKSQKIDPAKKMREAWAEIFEVDSDNTSEILRNLGLLHQLPSEIRNQVYSIDGEDHDLYLDKISRVENALSNINLKARWKNFKETIDEATLTELKFCSKLLSKKSEFRTIDKKDREDLLKRIQDLKNEMSDFNINEDLRRAIFDKLSEIERAIFDYRLTGGVLIKKEVESALANVVVRALNQDESLTRKLLDLFAYIAATITVGEHSYQLAQKITQLLNP